MFIECSAAHLIHELKPELVQSYISSACREPRIVPMNFQQLHKNMAKHTVKVLAKQRVRIHPRFDRLITSLNSATTKDDEYSLDKTKSAFNDLFDAFRLALLCLHSAGE